MSCIQADELSEAELRKALVLIDECDALYIDDTISTDETSRLLDKVGGMPILTVGESAVFWSEGGVIRIKEVDHRLVFDINLDSAGKVGLSFRSKLLRLAHHIQEGS